MAQHQKALPEGISFRPADPVRDFAYAYDLFRRCMEGPVAALAGTWPETQRAFFWQGFNNPDTHMILHEGKPVGCFCVTETPQAVKLQRMYIEPEFQGQGIGREILALALEKAHEARKPLELEVLITNTPAIAAYTKWGFTTFGETSYEWVREHKMRHRDTLAYATAPAPLAPRAFG